MTRYYPAAPASEPVRAYTTGGRRVNKGEVLTGADITALYVQNGVAKIEFTPNSGIHCHLKRWDGSSYKTCMDPVRGDWTYFAIDPPTGPDRVTVVEDSGDMVQLSVEWTNYSFASYSGGGIGLRDRDNNLCFAEGQVLPNYKKITSTRLVKCVIMRRGAEGFEAGYHTDPHVGPHPEDLPALNNDTAFGEREFGDGGGDWVIFSSANVTWRFPGDGVHQWLGIDDPASAGGAEQSAGPFWAASLHYTNITEADGLHIQMCRYVVLRRRLQTGAFQFGVGASGAIVVNQCNTFNDAANMPFPTMVFIGAFPYVTADFDVEPTASLSSTVAQKAAGIFV